MRSITILLAAMCLLAGTARADDAAARSIIDDAIRAHGGEAALAKWPVRIVKTEGIFHGYEKTPVFFFTCETTTHAANQIRTVLDGKINVPNGKPNPQQIRIVNALDHQRGWVRMAGDDNQSTNEFSPAQLIEQQHNGYLAWISTLAPLKHPEFTLTDAGEEKDGNQTMIGVRVSSRGRRDVTLFFDKESKLLVKTMTRATAGTGVEGKVETNLRLHKPFQGVQCPTMFATYYNGRSLISHWVRDCILAEKPAPGTFDKP